MTAGASFIHHPSELSYHFYDSHPFSPTRQQLTLSLLEHANAVPKIIQPAPATDEQIRLIHRTDYIDVVKALSEQQPATSWEDLAPQFGLDSEDTPYFPGMHEAASIIVGGSIAAADLVMTGKTPHAFHMAGGLHHAFSGRGSGFCVYNDASIAIAHIRKQYDARVLYIDTDVHHGDGVQWSFYSEPEVCTYSIHETGKFLFPGTGFVHERGNAEGFGSCFNVPVEPYTEDDSWLECFRASIEKVVCAFKPDIIVSQHGCDAHAFDPLSHVHCSMRIYREMPAIIHQLAHDYAGGKWVALGGGGYDVWRVVPRAWALVWLEMSDHPLTDAIGASKPPVALPEPWLAQWSALSPDPLPTEWLDDTSNWPAMPRRKEITQNNRAMMQVAVQEI